VGLAADGLADQAAAGRPMYTVCPRSSNGALSPSQALMPPVIQAMTICGCGDARILIGAVMPV
jgi:hypothetical protein